MHDFSDRVIIITGALGGIGMATATAFARGGAKLVLADLKEATDEQTRALSDDGANAVKTVACDMSDEAAIDKLVAATLEKFGRIDVIVNIAGAMIYRSIADMSGTDWQAMLAINLVGPALLAGAGLRHMTAAGVIINVGSIHARQTTKHVAGYAAAKAGLGCLTRSAAIEGKPHGIRVNTVLPGAIDTPMLRESPTIKSGDEIFDPADIGKPEDIAATVAFLASDAAAFITGAEILADGGRLANL